MQYQYKIIGLTGDKYDQKTFYKFETEYPYTFNAGDSVWFPENWKEELGGGFTWQVKRVEHYPIDKFIAVYVCRE